VLSENNIKKYLETILKTLYKYYDYDDEFIPEYVILTNFILIYEGVKSM